MGGGGSAFGNWNEENLGLAFAVVVVAVLLLTCYACGPSGRPREKFWGLTPQESYRYEICHLDGLNPAPLCAAANGAPPYAPYVRWTT